MGSDYITKRCVTIKCIFEDIEKYLNIRGGCSLSLEKAIKKLSEASVLVNEITEYSLNIDDTKDDK